MLFEGWGCLKFLLLLHVLKLVGYIGLLLFVPPTRKYNFQGSKERKTERKKHYFLFHSSPSCVLQVGEMGASQGLYNWLRKLPFILAGLALKCLHNNGKVQHKLKEMCA